MVCFGWVFEGPCAGNIECDENPVEATSKYMHGVLSLQLQVLLGGWSWIKTLDR